jgi:hypothetical protein
VRYSIASLLPARTTGVLVERFEARVGRSVDDLPPDAFGSPTEIEAYERETPVEALGGESLGRAVLRHTSWTAIKRISI